MMTKNSFLPTFLRFAQSEKSASSSPRTTKQKSWLAIDSVCQKPLPYCCPMSRHCELFNNKADSYEFARKLGIPVPRRIDYREPTELAQAIDHAGVKRTVIKLLKGNSAKGVFYAETPQETQQLVQHLIAQYQLTAARFPQVEQRVEGDGWGYSVLYWKGQQIADFTHRRLREKLRTGGTSTLRETASHTELQQAAKRLFDEIGWHGLAMSEFKVCPKTGQFWFIEVNPRMWGSIPLAISAGVEFPYLAWLSATEGPNAARAYHRTCQIRRPWRGRWVLGDLLVAVKQMIRLQPRATWTTLFGSKADSWDDLYLDDPLPFAGEVLYYVANALTKRSLNPSEDGMVG